ncbi:MAG: hypothetical protein FP831_12235 [Anaerolineae bacterium]|nr:hypothetical protein [Anaerolineae bacterium]
MKLSGYMILGLMMIGCNNIAAPVEVTKTYLIAMASKDANQISACSSAEWEIEAQKMLDSFIGVDTILEDLVCREIENDGLEAKVNCDGRIIMTYNNEDMELELSVVTFVLKQNRNEWQIYKLDYGVQ